MTKLAKEVDLLEKKIKLIKENYSIFSEILNDLSDTYFTDGSNIILCFFLQRYELKLREKNLERKRETNQLDIEDLIKEIKNEI